MKPYLYFVIVGGLLAVTNCSEQAREAKGFALPKGDIEKGKSAFVALDCHRCHSVDGANLAEHPKKSAVAFALGGEVRRVKSAGQLVTSIIQPQHVVSPQYLRTVGSEAPSPMPSPNEQMKVSQLVDIVAFLHAHYTKVMPDYYDDYIYTMP